MKKKKNSKKVQSINTESCSKQEVTETPGSCREDLQKKDRNEKKAEKRISDVKEKAEKSININSNDDRGYDSPYSDIHEKAEGIPEDLAEDIVEAIEEAHERGEKRSKKSKHHSGALSFREVLIAVGFGIVLYWALNHTSSIFAFLGSVADVFSPLIIGFCIAFILNLVLIPVESLWKKVTSYIKNVPVSKYISKIKRPVCIVLSTLITAGLICGLFLIVIPELGVTFRMFADMAPGFIKKLEVWLEQLSVFLAERGLTLPDILPDPDKAISFVSDLFTEKGQQMLDTTVGVTTSIFSVVFDTVLAFVFAFYVLAQKERLSSKVRSILYAVLHEEKADNIIKIATLSNSAFTKFVTGQFAEAVIIGVLCWLGMVILRMPYAAVVSVVIGATALIPIFGAFVGAAIGAILIVGVDFMQAIWFIVFIIVLQQIETNLIYPRVVGKSIGLPGILVLASVTVGGAIFGFAGIVLGIPVCSVIYCIFNEFVDKRIEDKGEKAAKKISDKEYLSR